MPYLARSEAGCRGWSVSIAVGRKVGGDGQFRCHRLLLGLVLEMCRKRAQSDERTIPLAFGICARRRSSTAMSQRFHPPRIAHPVTICPSPPPSTFQTTKVCVKGAQGSTELQNSSAKKTVRYYDLTAAFLFFSCALLRTAATVARRSMTPYNKPYPGCTFQRCRFLQDVSIRAAECGWLSAVTRARSAAMKPLGNGCSSLASSRAHARLRASDICRSVRCAVCCMQSASNNRNKRSTQNALFGDAAGGKELSPTLSCCNETICPNSRLPPPPIPGDNKALDLDKPILRWQAFCKSPPRRRLLAVFDLGLFFSFAIVVTSRVMPPPACNRSGDNGTAPFLPRNALQQSRCFSPSPVPWCFASRGAPQQVTFMFACARRDGDHHIQRFVNRAFSWYINEMEATEDNSRYMYNLISDGDVDMRTARRKMGMENEVHSRGGRKYYRSGFGRHQ